MRATRRAALLALAACTAARGAAAAGDAAIDSVHRGRKINFPRDHGAHLGSNIEWWYVTGWLGTFDAPRWGFQITFFRSRTGLAADSASRFAPAQLLFAHAALTDLELRRPVHLHAQRVARWSGRGDAPLAAAAIDDTALHIARWSLRSEAGVAARRLRAEVDGDFGFTLDLQATQPPLLQGDAGFSLKAPQEQSASNHASHYISEPQLQVRAEIAINGRRTAAQGRAWLDHEWSDSLLHPDAVGWDWIGINLADGSALTAFRLRRSDGSALWAGGSWRGANAAAQAFAAEEVRFTPGRVWASPASGARYPVQWRVDTPAGRFDINALLDAQELDGRRSMGMLYWEGLCELLDARGVRVGLGYLEMTGYAAPIKLS